MLPRSRRAPLLALAPLLLAASVARVAECSLGAATAVTGPPAIDSAWARRRDMRSQGVALHSRQLLSLDKVARLRGGIKRAAVKADDEDTDADENEEDGGAGIVSGLMDNIKDIPPVTRIFMFLLVLITAVDTVSGEALDAGSAFSLDWGRTVKGLELWRPLTSLIYLGPLSMNWLTNVYFMTQHGTRLELVSGTAEQVIFLLLVGALLLAVGPLIGMPFMATSMVAAHTHVSARMEPLGSVQFQIFRIPTWILPFAQMGAAVLQAEGNLLAAIPHVVGIVCGHVYHFFTVVHPLMGAKRRVGAPGWMKRRLDGGDNPNFMEAPDEPAAPRGRKIGSGKKKAASSKSKGGKGAGGSSNTKSKTIPEFPEGGGGCSG